MTGRALLRELRHRRDYFPFISHLEEAVRKCFNCPARSPPLPNSRSCIRIQRARAFGFGTQRAPIGGAILCPAKDLPLPILIPSMLWGLCAPKFGSPNPPENLVVKPL